MNYVQNRWMYIYTMHVISHYNHLCLRRKRREGEEEGEMQKEEEEMIVTLNIIVHFALCKVFCAVTAAMPLSQWVFHTSDKASRAISVRRRDGREVKVRWNSTALIPHVIFNANGATFLSHLYPYSSPITQTLRRR